MPPRGHAHTKGGKSKVPRPKTSPGFQQVSSRRHTASVQPALNYDDEAIPEDDEEEHIELLEYEWPDLPPLPSMKDAVSRRRVSQGISYLLPVDKGRNSINNRFRTDLRAMFQEPYASDDLQYDDNRVKLSAKVHFLSNTADTKWTRAHLSSIPTQLNADCEGARKLYVHSAPTGGMASRRMGIDPNKLRKRSNLFLPVKASKAQVSPEIVKLREEAAEIIKQGLTYNEDDEDEPDQKAEGKTGQNLTSNLFHQASSSNPHNQTNAQQDARVRPTTVHDPSHMMLSTFGGSQLGESLGSSGLNARLKDVNINQERFSTYEDLKKSTPPKSIIPTAFRSTFLSEEENQRVWEWLHYGESMSEFDFFLSVCG